MPPNDPTSPLPADDGTLSLPPLLELTRADSLHGALQAHVAQDAAVRIDASAVERVSTACVQLLVAAAIAARARGREFALVAPSAAMRQAVHDLGLVEALGVEAA